MRWTWRLSSKRLSGDSKSNALSLKIVYKTFLCQAEHRIKFQMDICLMELTFVEVSVSKKSVFYLIAVGMHAADPPVYSCVGNGCKDDDDSDS